MSTQVANLNIGGLSVGQSSSISFGQALPPPTIQQQMNAAANISANLFLFNESGSGLRCTLPVSGESFTLAAGQWRIVLIPPNEVQLSFTVVYVLANAPVTQLLADLYLPGETIDAIGVLGNSPIGLSAVSLPVTQVIQDGQPNGQTIVEATPSGQPQHVLITTDGAAFFAATMQATTVKGPAGADFFIVTNNAGSAMNLFFQPWTGSALVTAFGIGDHGVAPFQVSSVGIVKAVGSQATAGKYGVPVTVADTKDQAITNTTTTTIASFTTPNDGVNHRVRLGMTFWIGAGNTNTGNITSNITWTDPVQGLDSTSLGNYTSNGALISNSALAKGNVYFCTPLELEASPNTSVTVNYQNQAAGTISDKVSAHIELLA